MHRHRGSTEAESVDLAAFGTAEEQCQYLQRCGQTAATLAVKLDLTALFLGQDGAVGELLKLASPLAKAATKAAEACFIIPFLLWQSCKLA